MSIIRIEAQKLRRMENNEGLVIQGCGGDWTIVKKVDKKRELKKRFKLNRRQKVISGMRTLEIVKVDVIENR